MWQDEWLIDCEEREYDKTRYWVQVMRRHCGAAQGLRWTSKRCRPRAAVQFFGDRGAPCAADRTPEESWRLDSPEGLERANRLLSPLRSVIFAPRLTRGTVRARCPALAKGRGSGLSPCGRTTVAPGRNTAPGQTETSLRVIGRRGHFWDSRIAASVTAGSLADMRAPSR
ncbi:hypothetical protein ACR6C2_25340 [Streptomyces sp. INA 01156]